jgi:hypothetical protein
MIKNIYEGIKALYILGSALLGSRFGPKEEQSHCWQVFAEGKKDSLAMSTILIIFGNIPIFFYNCFSST